ncbi:histone H1-like [Zingiber officinale]|uniref:histone H1-like n=1 Tax=Zingiber officinale TaxID=94328 RepID=UPI001C4B76D2|nr:histone H1-like [Zingiber officinale]
MPALEEPIVRMETYDDDKLAPAKPAAEEGAIAPAVTVKAAKAKAKAPSSKAKKPTGPRRTSAHPPYAEMIKEAILTLKERTGSSPYAIAKAMEDKHKAHLPANFRKMLLLQLKKLAAAGKLAKVKSSYKLSSATASVVVATAKVTTKNPISVASKAKPKVRPVASIAKPKSKTVANAKSKAKTVTKPKPVAVKPKSATKRKASAKANPKRTARLAKSAKVLAKDAPGRKAVKAPVKSAAAPKKTPVRKPKTSSTTAKKSKK